MKLVICLLFGILSTSAFAEEFPVKDADATTATRVLLAVPDAVKEFSKIVNAPTKITEQVVSHTVEPGSGPRSERITTVTKYEFRGSRHMGDMALPGGRLIVTETQICEFIYCGARFESTVEPANPSR